MSESHPVFKNGKGLSASVAEMVVLTLIVHLPGPQSLCKTGMCVCVCTSSSFRLSRSMEDSAFAASITSTADRLCFCFPAQTHTADH